MSQPAHRRRGRLPARESRLPTESDWQRSELLEPRPASREPELISDGGGLPFAPAALAGAGEPLDPDDPAVAALLAHLSARTGARRARRAPWQRAAPAPPVAAPLLEDWRLLARTDGEALFGRGFPPQLLTVAVRRAGRSRAWTHAGSSAARPLRATREGIRASSWRLDPTRERQPDDSVLRVLVSEQTFASGQRADGRVQVPDLYVDDADLVLTIFVTPRPGYQSGSRNPETPVRIALPLPVGRRRLIDGALARV